jgi:uncharacterized protein YecE (DUF72 family)
MTDKKNPHIHVGVAGWYYPDWQGIVYPAGMPKMDHLKYLASFVDAIEINNTFYRPPEPADVARWCGQVENIPGFRFTLKLWQRFTHSREERWEPAELADFLARVRPIFERGLGGALLAQFPHSFHFTRENAEYLEALVSRIGGIPLVVEVRHKSWDNPEAFSLLRNIDAGICSIDQPMFRGSLGPVEEVTGEVAYIRLHGRNYKTWFSSKAGRDERYDYLYKEKELEPWAGRALRLAEKAEDVYAIANNHFRGQEVCNALMLKSMLEKRRVRAPAPLLQSFPILNNYVVPDTPVQGTLL